LISSKTHQLCGSPDFAGLIPYERGLRVRTAGEACPAAGEISGSQQCADLAAARDVVVDWLIYSVKMTASAP
jgi:hypothetical protein